MMAQPAKRNRMVLQQHRQKNKPNSLTMIQSQENKIIGLTMAQTQE